MSDKPSPAQLAAKYAPAPGGMNAKARRAAGRADGTHASVANAAARKGPSDTQAAEIRRLSYALAIADPSIPATWSDAEHKLRRLRAEHTRLEQRDKPAAPAPAQDPRPATSKQRELLQTLARRAGIRAQLPAGMSITEASRRIDAFQAKPTGAAARLKRARVIR